MPTDEQIENYAKNLPEIYREILHAFPEIEPGRKAGYGLAFQTLFMHFVNMRRFGCSLGDVREACLRLAADGILDIKNEIFAHPTDLGERLIAAVSKKPVASSPKLPELPARSW